jgi:hypothetical protein
MRNYKHREGSGVVALCTWVTHSCSSDAALVRLKPNTSIIERRNGTARRMSAHQVWRSLTFAHRSNTKLALGWWGVTTYNWCRPHRSLRDPFPEPQGKKVSVPDTRHGVGTYRLHLLDPRPSPYPCLLNRWSEIISPVYP